MTDPARSDVPSVIGPYGSRITLEDLPKAKLDRWVIRRKAELVAAVRGGLLTLDDACNRYHLSRDEFAEWEAQLARYGLPGLKVTKIQQRRPRQGVFRL